MRKKLLIASLIVLAIVALGVLALASSTPAEACVHCVGGNCQAGGDGVICREAHWPNGSSVCWWTDGCVK